MQKQNLIVITGAAGFIGSCLVARLNELGYENLVLVDDFSNLAKTQNTQHKQFSKKIHRDQFIQWCEEHLNEIQYIFHLGARTDTTLQDEHVFKTLNVTFSQELWAIAVAQQIPFVYASSAATYGDGSLGYEDNTSIIPTLKPLNPYAVSKQAFDKWVLKQEERPPFWAGLKFFNVYGPNEYHKGRMASVVMHAFQQIKDTGKVKLFKSHHPDYIDGGQQRDFIYVMDVIDVCIWLMEHQKHSDIYNLGTGTARTFNDLVLALFTALELHPNIEYVDTPLDIRSSYQYYTQATMHKLKDVGYSKSFHSLEQGVLNYARAYLVHNKKIY